MLQCLAQIVRALAQLIKQPSILDGDDRLGGEILDQLDLLIGERQNFLAEDGERADHLLVLHHGYN